MVSLSVAPPDPRASALDVQALPPIAVAGLYVHVPFCFHKCHYCDFYSITRQSPQRMAAFVDLLLAEADLWRDSRVGLSPQTIFFGGGTPSLLPQKEMERLTKGLRQRFEMSGMREWTVEVNPATADLEYLCMLRSLGVDRISIGAQSFEPRELSLLERHHDPDDVRQAVKLARLAGFSRLSVDLIYAIPSQSIDSWRRSLGEALALQTEHLSCYNLTYEPNTPLAVRRRLGRIQPVPEEHELEMFYEARRMLEQAGLPAYEVSNYAAPGCESLHNLGYWRGESYLGLGPSAASHLEGRRFRNQPHLGLWEQAVSSGNLPVIDFEQLTARQRSGELAMLNLRLSGGIDLADFQRRTGADARLVFSDAIQRLSSAGLLLQKNGSIRLTDKAWGLSDGIAAEFLHDTNCA